MGKPKNNSPKYVQIDDAPELWDDVCDYVVDSVDVATFDQLVDSGYIDQDGKILVDTSSIED